MEYNQLKQNDTFFACSIYALLNLFRYDYGIYVELNYILKFLIYLEKIWVFFRLEWAYAKYIFPAALKYINSKLGLNLTLVTTSLSRELSNKHGYILWYRRANTIYKKEAQDWEITKKDIDKIKDTPANWHFHYFKKGRTVESLWGFRYRLSKQNLKYAHSLWMYYDNIRYITWEEELKEELIKIVKFRKIQKLKNPYVWYDEVKKIKKQLKYKNYD